MFGTIESAHNKITEKISLVKQALVCLRSISVTLYEHVGAATRKAEVRQIIDDIHINLVIDSLESLENNYNLSIVDVLARYYESNENENKSTHEYYRIITSENFIAQLEDFISRANTITSELHKVLQLHILTKQETKDSAYLLDDISKKVTCAHNIKIDTALEKRDYDVCRCGSRMTVVPELSELHCPCCSKIKTIIGAVFRDDQFYPQEGQKTKHGGYDTSRHYRFWIERLQALESKTFEESDLAHIEYVIERDEYDRKTLTCEQMREILKDPKVAATHLNDHAPLLVKTFGGPAPPQLDFQENRLASIRFNTVMRLYDIINPDGGNKPYYPYFIYKILEYMFRDCPSKQRILDYIHLQSRETIIKNDKYYEQICALAKRLGIADGLEYSATDSASRL